MFKFAVSPWSSKRLLYLQPSSLNGVNIMKIKHAIAALAACTMMSGAAVAFDSPQGQNRKAQAKGKSHNMGPHNQAQQNRRDRRANSASTSTTGAAVTTRNGGAAAIDSRGMATGQGSVRSSSEGEVFSSTTRDGSDADAFGRSEAEAQEPQQQQQRRRSRPN